MRSLKLIVLSSLIITGLIIAGCKKETFTSRDPGGLVPPPPAPPPPVDPSLVMFDAADDAATWETVGAPVLQTTGQKEGAGYIQGKIASGGDFLQFIVPNRTPALDTKLTPETAQLTFWLNIPNVSLLKVDGQIQVSSAGQPDSKRYGWALADIIPTLHDGWNQITLDISAANVAGDGGADLSAMNFFKIFFWTAAPTTADFVCAIDGIQFKAKSDTPPPPPPVDLTLVMFDAADLADGWETVGAPVVKTTGQKEGAGYIEGKITTGGDFLQFIKPNRTPPLDTKLTPETAQLTFWLNIPDVSLLKLDGHIQVSSSGQPDNKRYGWPLAGIIPTLHNGWNQLTLDVSAAEVSGDGPANLAAMNFFKIFFWTNAPVTADFVCGVDAIQFKSKTGTPPPPPPPLISVSFNPCDALDNWEISGDKPRVIETVDKKEGAGWIKADLLNGVDYLHFIYRRPALVNPGLTEANGQLKFWWYISDISQIKTDDGQIEITGAGESDKKEYAWNVADVLPSLHNGWNEVKLDFSTAIKSADGGPDLTQGFNLFRVYFWPKAPAHPDMIIGLDDIRLIEKP